MTPKEFNKVRIGDELMIHCVVRRHLTSEDGRLEALEVTADHGSLPIIVLPDEVVGYASFDNDWIVGDRVLWCDNDGWFIVHLAVKTSEAVILHDKPGFGAKRVSFASIRHDRGKGADHYRINGYSR